MKLIKGAFARRTLATVITAALVAGLVAATTVVAGGGFVKTKTYKKNEGVFEAFLDGPVDTNSVGAFPTYPTPPALTPVATLPLEKGKYHVTATAWNHNATTAQHVYCQLASGASVDATEVQSRDDDNSLALQIGVKVSSPGAATLSCADDGAAGNTDNKLAQIKLIADRARSVRITPATKH